MLNSQNNLYFFCKFSICSRLPITRTLANSNQHRFHTDFDTFTAILPLVTRTLDDSSLPLTWTSFHFPSGHFVYKFSLDISKHTFQDVSSKKIHYCWSKHWIYLMQAIVSILPVSPVQGRLHFVPISSSFNSFFKTSINFCCPLKCSVHGT